MSSTIKLTILSLALLLAPSTRAAPNFFDQYGGRTCPCTTTTVFEFVTATATPTTTATTATETETATETAFPAPGIKNGLLPAAGETTSADAGTTLDSTTADPTPDVTAFSLPIEAAATPPPVAAPTDLPACAIASVADGYTSCDVGAAHVAALNSDTLISCIQIACNPAETTDYIVRALYQCQMLECQARLNNNGIFPTIGAGTPW
ncbi:hypothetical protein BDK51DRAFT_35190 [Blyttiomyces helicus]|uniref:Extracellular membrane protein CFEM domain-containing protein n=1 Tax=Blyttiomyces helicus TaxID=388810 RepID=A0A4V1IRW0_9FUNG|nr:hypothetical protein BDK51DRAFT_35190 [Blyttiomyces helicus]|eukprot:RKO91427.1 hypothetical protein BDK51DRAFT_35190 [Blyttiomyces helicus]